TALPDRDVERGPPHVRLLPDPVREVLPDPLPELNHAVRARLLDQVLDQGHERDIEHAVWLPPASYEGLQHLPHLWAPLPPRPRDLRRVRGEVVLGHPPLFQ